jgi:RHS repeat-associated protein
MVIDPNSTNVGSVKVTGSVVGGTTTAALLLEDLPGHVWSDFRATAPIGPAVVAGGSTTKFVGDRRDAGQRAGRRVRKIDPPSTLRAYNRSAPTAPRARRLEPKPAAGARGPATLRRYQRGASRKPVTRAARSAPARRPAVTKKAPPTLSAYARPAAPKARKRPANPRPRPQAPTTTASADKRTAKLLRRLPTRSPDSPTWRPTREDRGTDWVSGRSDTQWRSLPALAAGPRVTALAGQALTVDGLPLAGLEVAIENSRARTKTDRTGRFLLAGAPAGRHVLLIDGRSVSKGDDARYGRFESRVTLARGRTTQLDHTVWMTRLDPEGDKRVPAKLHKPVVLTNPRMPGFEVRIPAGSRITSAEGRTVRRLNLTPVPTDRPPFPLPEGVTVSAYFTAQPGRAYLSKGAQIVYPNYHHLPPGQRVDFWNYDADDKGWYVYGKGEVTKDAKQIVPDPGVRVWELTGAMAQTSSGPPASGPSPGGGASGGDPVDLATGLFVYDKTDLHLDGLTPLALTRIYRPGDANNYGFGRGTTSPWDLRLWNDTAYTVARLVLPDGGAVRFERTSAGTDQATAVYAAKTPGPYAGAVLRWVADSSRWEVALRNGTVYEFDGFLPVSAVRDRFGNRQTIVRNRAAGPPTQVTAANGGWIRFALNASEQIVEARDHAGRVVQYTYDANSRLASATSPGGRTTRYTYDAAGQMTVIRDARGIDFLKNRYDAQGRVVEQTQADGTTYKFDYHRSCVSGSEASCATWGPLTTTVTDPRGIKRRVTFDAATLPLRDVLAADTVDEEVTTIERDGDGRPVRTTDPTGLVTTFEYDAAGNVIRAREGVGTAKVVVRSRSFDRAQRLTGEVDANGSATTYTYDRHGQLTTITDPTGRSVGFAYEGTNGQPASIDIGGSVTKLTYANGVLTARRDALGNETRHYVDTLGRVTATTDALGRQTRREFDDDGLLMSVTNPAGAKTSWAYDANGNVVSLTDARGNATTASYDVMDRVQMWTDAAGRSERFEHDANGNVTRVVDRAGQVRTLRYDGRNRTSFVGFGATGSTDSPNLASSLSYKHNARGDLTEISDSGAPTISIGYDVLGNKTSETSTRGTVTYGYDRAGRRTGMIVGGQPGVTYGYDTAGRLTSVRQGDADVAIGYDNAGRRATVTFPNGIVQRSDYDVAGRLSALQYDSLGLPVGGVRYERDSAGRVVEAGGSLVKTRLPDPLASATYDPSNRIVSRDGLDFIYDPNGNLVDDGTTRYRWNARGELAALASASTAAEFQYDAFGRRSHRVVDGRSSAFLYDGWNVVAELREGATEVSFLTGLELDEVFARTSDSARRSVLTDGVGSTVALASLDGGLSTTPYAYGPFGESGDAGEHSFQYTGRENDDTGLLHYRHRYYSPTLKRFISEDPLGFAGGDVNVHAYVGNDPLNSRDPLGLMAVPGGGGGAGCMPAPTTGRKSFGMGGSSGLGFLSGCASLHQSNASDAGSPSPDDTPDTGPSKRAKGTNPGEVARKTGHPVKEVKEAIHQGKKGLEGNPDVDVDDDGNIRPINHDGSLGDVHDNIYDHLPER